MQTAGIYRRIQYLYAIYSASIPRLLALKIKKSPSNFQSRDFSLKKVKKKEIFRRSNSIATIPSQSQQRSKDIFPSKRSSFSQSASYNDRRSSLPPKRSKLHLALKTGRWPKIAFPDRHDLRTTICASGRENFPNSVRAVTLDSCGIHWATTASYFRDGIRKSDWWTGA